MEESEFSELPLSLRKKYELNQHNQEWKVANNSSNSTDCETILELIKRELNL